MKNKVNIILNGNHTTAFDGETILDVAKRHDIEIPTLCFDERLKPNSSCFVCVVEVDQNGRKAMQPSCSTLVTEGMHIDTENAEVRKSRKTALELLLSNHYADCIAPCKETCPAGVDVQGYISLIEKKRYTDAVALIKETNPLPAICGRVCVRPCEVACRRNLLDEENPVGIDYLKRFASDIDLQSVHYAKPRVNAPTGKKVAIIGAGPGGLSAAWFLLQQGHQCTIFEAQPYAGGWLRYGIPEYRLPNNIIDKEVDRILELGGTIEYNQKLGANLSYKRLQAEFDATILTIGSQRGTLLRVEGEEAENVFSGIDFLRNMEETGQRYDFTNKKIAVVGGGNTAMDCCRTAIRCGSTDVKVIYRRTEKEMPANPIEIHESKLEGVQYDLLTNPTKVNQDETGKVKSMTLIKMELGEPDESGRRRPQPIEGSTYEEEFDYILAAIGQKTDINFLDDINKNSPSGELKANRWGDIDCDAATLQTGIPSVFAAGDGVTGPATIIEAIAQAKVAAHSCHQYLQGLPVKAEKKPFFSRKENFKPQQQNDYIGRYHSQLRAEMPTIPEDSRVNFKEVELGYSNEETAVQEANRCMECGCSALYHCDLKAYATDYEANQEAFSGEFNEHDVDFSHPFIEIDNNKCILCTRCVRICRDVVGANALGLIDRGFETVIAPAMGASLLDTNCESCGMCISACPTGALSENSATKPLPVKTESIDTLCNYCSIGCQIRIHHRNGFVTHVTGIDGQVNTDGNICRYARFGYQYMNSNERITEPLIRKGESFEKISFKKAFNLITEKFSQGKPERNALFAGARLANEELFSLRKLAKQGLRTNLLGSFHYLGREDGFSAANRKNLDSEQVESVKKVFLVGANLNMEHAVLGYKVQEAVHQGAELTVITDAKESPMSYKAHRTIRVKSYYHLAKAMNYVMLSNSSENKMFINSNTTGYDAYKSELLAEKPEVLAEQCGMTMSEIEALANAYNLEPNALFIVSERNVCTATVHELSNLALLTGKLGKTATGLIVLKEKNNSQGLMDMGIGSNLKFGGIVDAQRNGELYSSFLDGQIENMMIWGEDPLGTAKEPDSIRKIVENTSFVVVQDAFMTPTAKMADIILPASFTIESSRSYTNTNVQVQSFEVGVASPIKYTTLEQIVELLQLFDVEATADSQAIFNEIAGQLPDMTKQKQRFIATRGPGAKALFNAGADSIVHAFDVYSNDLLDT
ncbi:MAG: molybdopterin-dependent oxidoreductase [Salinivirgaceae bacterium]